MIMKQKIAIVIIILSVFTLGVLFAASVRHKQDAALMAQLSADEASKEEEQVPENTPTPEPTVEPELAEEVSEEVAIEESARVSLPILPEFDQYLSVNPYVAGWLKIDDSVIDVPVVYTPGSQNYFLHRDLEGNSNSCGTLFIGIDWEEGYNNTLIYGHNMKDGTGFGSLSKYSKESYGASHPVIYFDTLYEKREYELYAAFYSQIDEEELETEDDREDKDKALEEAAIEKKAEEGVTVQPEELSLFDLDLTRDFGGKDIFRTEKDEDNGRFRYYYYTNLSDRDDFDYYAKNVKERALYDTGVSAEWGDEFITLSTCSYQVKNGRFVVVGVRKRASE